MPNATRSPGPWSRLPAITSLILAALLALAGCADRPPAASFLAYPQKKLQSARHWEIVAADVAAAVSTYLQEQEGKKDPVQVYMMRDDGTLFSDAFQQSLITAFVKAGNPVAVDARPDAISVGIDVMVVPHHPDRPNRTVPGKMTALGSGIWVGSAILDAFPWGAGATWFGLGADAIAATVNESTNEIMLTVSLAKNGFYVYRASAVYYVLDKDIEQYGGEAAYRTFNDVPPAYVGRDLGGSPYVTRPRRNTGAAAMNPASLAPASLATPIVLAPPPATPEPGKTLGTVMQGDVKAAPAKR